MSLWWARPCSKSLFNHEEHEVHEGIWENMKNYIVFFVFLRVLRALRGKYLVFWTQKVDKYLFEYGRAKQQNNPSLIFFRLIRVNQPSLLRPILFPGFDNRVYLQSTRRFFSSKNAIFYLSFVSSVFLPAPFYGVHLCGSNYFPLCSSPPRSFNRGVSLWFIILPGNRKIVDSTKIGLCNSPDSPEAGTGPEDSDIINRASVIIRRDRLISAFAVVHPGHSIYRP